MCARPPTPPPKYKAVELRMWRKHAKQVVPELNGNNRGLLQRIATYAKKFKYTDVTIKREIRRNPMFAATFSKAPNRTTIHERMAAKWLRKELQLNVSVSLPSQGQNAFYIETNGVISHNNTRGASKSLDFYWQINGTDFYAMHKYTHQRGGNQDNQRREMEQALQNFRGATNQNKVLIVIVDGDYYDVARMRALNSLTRNHTPKSFAVHIEDVPQIVAQYR